MKMSACACLSLFLAGGANAQSAIEHHAWQDARSFQPISTTARAITGAISLSGNPDFASEGSTMTISFENGSKVGLISKGAWWRTWDIGSEAKQTAEVFRLERDPGVLLYGNTLCGDTMQDQPIFVVFYESSLFGGELILNVGFFQSQEPPHDINSSGLCGTFSYAIE